MKTFEENKTIKELGIDVNRKLVVVKGDCFFNKGDILELSEDDDTDFPFFKRITDGTEAYIHLYELAYYEEESDG